MARETQDTGVRVGWRRAPCAQHPRSRTPGINESEGHMAASTAAPTRTTDRDGHRHTTVTKSTETKAAFKTTELIAYVVATLGVLIAAAIVDESDAGGL